MRLRVLAAAPLAALLAVVAIAGAGGGSGARTTKVTVWATPTTAAATAYGGVGYGGYTPVTGAMISEQRELDVGTGELRIPGVAATIDPGSVQLRDLSDPSAVITEQRFQPAATTPTEILQRHVGAQVTIVTPKGEVTGVLRAIDEATLVVEIGAGEQRRLQVMRRDGYVQDVRLPPGTGVDTPSLVWRLATKKPGRHTVELTYRADGMAWNADYLAVLDENGTSVDFSAWATVRNATGATFDAAELTLVHGGTTGPGAYNPYAMNSYRNTATPAPVRYTVPTPVHLAQGQSIQVELLPTKQKAKARPVVLFEAMPDPSISYQAYPNSDCNQFNGVGMGNGRAELAVEVDVPTKDPLPEGRVRAFRRKADHLEVVSEDPLRSSAGVARIRLASEGDVTGERRAMSCNYDERARSVTEKIEVRVENKSKRATEVVIREFAWRWPVWRLEGEDAKSVRAAPQTLEWRAQLPPGGKRTVTYSVVYTW